MSSDNKPFFWKKKFEKLGIDKIDDKHLEEINKKKFEENKRELEKIQRRKIEREKEKEERLKELERQQREKEAQKFEEWESQEDSFHLKQAKLRCKLRIKEGRAKPIDLLARYVDTFADKQEDDEEDETEQLPFRLAEPYLCLNGLRLNDLEDLKEDIKIYKKIDNEANLDFWSDIQTIVDDEMNKLRKFQNESVERRDGINPAVANEVQNIFENKTTEQLDQLQKQIEKKLDSKHGVDVSYWETLLSKLKAHLARSRLKELHQINMQKFASLENVFVEENPVIKEEHLDELNERSLSVKEQTDLLLHNCIDDYISGRYSPTPLSFDTIKNDVNIKVIDPADDWKELQIKRKLVMNSHKSLLNPSTDQSTESKSKDELAFERIGKQAMNDDERAFSNEVTIQQNSLSWANKYKPRKPRYFNRVHTGFEWNKYNQTHYDVDNPPPKIVQGYKFNIFYPDLIDKDKTPTYKLENCSESKDFKIIRFIAGPPYEDIAFKIVNREWNNSYKSGFRNQFHNNILQLWFHFKRMRYRR